MDGIRISKQNKMTPLYREGNLSDATELKALGIISYAQFSEILSQENWEMLNEYLHDDNALNELILKSKVFVCVDEKIVGMAFLVPSGNPTPIFESDWSYIRMVGVHPEYRGKGIAKRLTQMCVDYAKETNESTIALHTSEIMDDARHVYELIGFRQIKELPLLYGKRYWLYQLEL